MASISTSTHLPDEGDVAQHAYAHAARFCSRLVLYTHAIVSMLCVNHMQSYSPPVNIATPSAHHQCHEQQQQQQHLRCIVAISALEFLLALEDQAAFERDPRLVFPCSVSPQPHADSQ